jgi:hypothetical protein
MIILKLMLLMRVLASIILRKKFIKIVAKFLERITMNIRNWLNTPK